jgi:hypothetical protein
MPVEIRVGFGWRDDMPPDVEAIVAQDGRHERTCLLRVFTSDQLTGEPRACSICSIHPEGPAAEGIANTAGILSDFLELASRTENEFVGLVWFNFNAKRSESSPQSRRFSTNCARIEDGLKMFLTTVSASIYPRNQSIPCEWAMVSYCCLPETTVGD